MHDLHLAALPAGTEFEGYRLLGLLGAGGFGVTYLAEETAISRRVAIKEFLPASIAARVSGSREVRSLRPQDGQAFKHLLDRFLREAETLARLDHANIVPVLRYFERHGTAYIVMKFVAGESLGAVLKRRGRLSEGEVRWFLPSLLDGLAEVHRSNFLHRDLKPDNILLRADGHAAGGVAMLIDFGAARVAAADVSAMTRTAVISEGYAPYEQYDSHGRQGPWTDLYGLGATLYRAVAGVAPVNAPDRLIAKVRGQPDPLVPVATLAPGLSPALGRAIDRALALMEQDRPQSVAEFQALVQPGKEQPGEAPMPPSTPFPIEPAIAASGEHGPSFVPGTTMDRPLTSGPPIGPPLNSAPPPAPPSKSRRQGSSRRAWGWIAAASVLAIMVAGPGLDYWRSVMQRETEPTAASPPPATGAPKQEADSPDAERRRAEEEKRRKAEPAKPVPQPAQPAAPMTCPGLPKALDDAFADASDCALLQRTLMQALATAETDTITRWTNTRSGVSGTIKLSAAAARDGAVCRRAELIVVRVDGTKRAEAVACLKDGRWTIVE